MTDRAPAGVVTPPPGPEEPTLDAGPVGDAWIAHGLLFALNEFVLHGRGFAAVILPNGHLGIRGDKSARRDWTGVDPAAVDGAMRRFEQLLLSAQGENKRNHAPRPGRDYVGDVSAGGVDPSFRQPFGPAPTVG